MDLEISVVLPEDENLYMEDGQIYFSGPGEEGILLYIKEYPEIQTEVTVKGYYPSENKIFSAEDSSKNTEKVVCIFSYIEERKQRGLICVRKIHDWVRKVWR